MLVVYVRSEWRIWREWRRPAITLADLLAVYAPKTNEGLTTTSLAAAA
jgi:hypothetical protein